MSRYKHAHNVFVGIGRLTTDPAYSEKENKRTKSTYLECRFGMAINPIGRKKEDGPNRSTVFVQVQLWGKGAEYARDVARIGSGDQVWVSGELRNRTMEKDGKTFLACVVHAWELVLQMENLSAGEGTRGGAPKSRFSPAGGNVDPF